MKALINKKIINDIILYKNNRSLIQSKNTMNFLKVLIIYFFHQLKLFLNISI